MTWMDISLDQLLNMTSLASIYTSEKFYGFLNTFLLALVLRFFERDNFNDTISNMNQANIVPSFVLLSKCEQCFHLVLY